MMVCSLVFEKCFPVAKISAIYDAALHEAVENAIDRDEIDAWYARRNCVNTERRGSLNQCGKDAQPTISDTQCARL